MKTLTVVCPVYNEEEVIEAFYAELSAVLAGLVDRYQARILFVVDKSRDATMTALTHIARSDPTVQVLGLSARFGHQVSLVAGIDHCTSDIIVTMDSDLQHPPSLIPTLIAEYEKGFDIVYTTRIDTQDIGLFKRTTSRLFYSMINAISIVPINASAADFRLFTRRVARVFQTQLREHNQFMRGLFGWVGFKSTNVSFVVQKRRAGTSKYSLLRMVRFGIDGVVSFSKTPLQAATVVGLVFAIAGFLLAIVTVVQFFFDRTFPAGWATLVVIVSIFSGTQLIFLGVIGEYIGAIFDEVKNRPLYIAEERINFDHVDD